MILGYARVSTADQKLDLQLDALKNAGCDQVFKDVASGGNTNRKELERALKFLREGDTLVVWKLNRLGRSLRHLISVVTRLQKNNIYFKTLQENIDTSSPGGKLIFHIFGALAEFEKDLIRERTLAGLAAARARGKYGGRPRKLSKRKADHAKSLIANPHHDITEICRMFKVSKSTLYRYMQK